MSARTRRDQSVSLLGRVFRNPWVIRTGQSLVLSAAQRINYHALRGMADPSARPDVSRFARAAPWKITQDYVRDGTLELLCREVKERSVPGSLAELGVFRGDFALLMSTLLPGRRVHLFDTFEGFDPGELSQDRELIETTIDFSPTDPTAVRARFARPEMVELHVGRFPDTTAGVEDQFALVSIDADLYAPVLAGLRWFYPKLAPGGAIMVHDFNNAGFAGAKKAVREFQSEAGVGLVPLPDWGGSAVILKPGEMA